MNTYECVICLNVNHASKLHCSTCGAVPAKYSILGVPSRYYSTNNGDWFHAITIVVAYGADRAEHHRNSKSYMRTVPADYYAEGK